MMKRRIHIVRLSRMWVIAFLFVFGCDSYLDEAPDNRVDLDNLDKAALLLTNAYSIASPAFTDWMTDDFTYTIGTTIRPLHERLYRWEETEVDPGEVDSPEFFWYETYTAISHANEVLAVLDDLPAEGEIQERHRDAIRGEALLARAYGHFMLVNLFGAHIVLSGSRDPGIPYVTQPETVFIEQYERISVSRVYDRIEDDLLDGLDLVDDSFYNNSGKYHFNKNAALAFACRFYLFKGDPLRCKVYADELLQGNPEAYVRDFGSDEYQNANSSITAYPQVYSSPDEPANLMLMRKLSLVQRTDFAFGIENDFYGSLFATNPFGAIDMRENPALVKGQNAVFPLRYENLFERSSLNSNVGFPYHIGVMFRGEEVLLNRAEALTYSGDIDEAIADLQVLTDRRYIGADDLTLTRQKIRDFFADEDEELSDQFYLLNYILFERRKEFIAQGMRWFDVKRFEFEVEHEYPNQASILLSSDDPRKQLQIPTSAIELGGLEPNDR